MAAYVVFNTTLLELKKEKKQKTFFFVMHPSAECALQPALDYAHGLQTWDQAAATSKKAHHQRFRRRLTIAHLLHSLLTTRVGMRLTTSLARHRAIPYGLLLQLVR